MNSYVEFAIGVVFYNPTDEEVLKVKDYSEIVPRVYIYDNTEENPNPLCLINLKQDEYTYIANNKNDGIAVALNKLCNLAKKDGYKYLLLLDQDSIFKIEDIRKMFQEIRNHASKDIGIYTPEIHYMKGNGEIRARTVQTKPSTVFSEISWAITSGSVVSLEVYSQSSGFDEFLFIDRVDYEYCVQLRKLGFKTVRISGAILYQFLGETQGGIFKFSGHNPIRHYYIFRNRLYLVQKYKENFNGIKKVAYLGLTITRHLALVLICESRKTEKFKAIKVAYRDYKKGKMGKYDPENSRELA